MQSNFWADSKNLDRHKTFCDKALGYSNFQMYFIKSKPALAFKIKNSNNKGRSSRDQLLQMCKRMCLYLSQQCTDVRFASLLSGGFTTMAVINPSEKNWQIAPLCIVSEE
jgi:hypothetical protein